MDLIRIKMFFFYFIQFVKYVGLFKIPGISCYDKKKMGKFSLKTSWPFDIILLTWLSRLFLLHIEIMTNSQ